MEISHFSPFPAHYKFMQPSPECILEPLCRVHTVPRIKPQGPNVLAKWFIKKSQPTILDPRADTNCWVVAIRKRSVGSFTRKFDWQSQPTQKISRSASSKPTELLSTNLQKSKMCKTQKANGTKPKQSRVIYAMCESIAKLSNLVNYPAEDDWRAVATTRA